MYSCTCRVYFRGAKGVLSSPPPWKLAFPKFNMGLSPLGFIFAPLEVCVCSLLSEILKYM
jgi:hypothetical protein